MMILEVKYLYVSGVVCAISLFLSQKTYFLQVKRKVLLLN